MGDCYDTGYFNGQLVSLAGVLGKKYRGLKLHTESGQIAVAGVYTSYPQNPQRLWLLISNDSLRNLTIVFLDVILGNFATHVIKPGGNILINQNLPWTGNIQFAVDVAMQSGELYNLTEASVQP